MSRFVLMMLAVVASFAVPSLAISVTEGDSFWEPTNSWITSAFTEDGGPFNYVQAHVVRSNVGVFKDPGLQIAGNASDWVVDEGNGNVDAWAYNTAGPVDRLSLAFHFDSNNGANAQGSITLEWQAYNVSDAAHWSLVTDQMVTFTKTNKQTGVDKKGKPIFQLVSSFEPVLPLSDSLWMTKPLYAGELFPKSSDNDYSGPNQGTSSVPEPLTVLGMLLGAGGVVRYLRARKNA